LKNKPSKKQNKKLTASRASYIASVFRIEEWAKQETIKEQVATWLLD
jgi:hypothetical protein